MKTICVTLIDGGAADWGKHILLMPTAVTLCGQPTPEALANFPILHDPKMHELVSNYREEKEWDITCPKCLEMIEIMKNAGKKKP